jgi:hypothetical protein
MRRKTKAEYGTCPNGPADGLKGDSGKQLGQPDVFPRWRSVRFLTGLPARPGRHFTPAAMPERPARFLPMGC